MKNFTFFKKVTIVFFLASLLLIMSTEATYAYIDPSTGSLVLQVIIGALVGGLVVVKIFWAKIINTMKRLTRSQDKNE